MHQEKRLLSEIVWNKFFLATDSVYERPTEPSEPLLQSEECRVESEAVTEAPLRTERKQLFDCKVQPADNTLADHKY